MRFVLFKICCLMIGVLSMAGCQRVSKPNSDPTPPSIVWNVFNYRTNAQADHPGSPSLSAMRGERFRITLKANDPEGIKSIKLNPTLGSGELSWTCKAPPGGEHLAQNLNATLGPLERSVSPDANGDVLTSIFLMQDVDFTMECQKDWIFVSGTAKLTGQGINYFAGTTTGTLTFNVSL